jgi:hypothetical protein
MVELRWSPTEKTAARSAFEAAFARELAALRHKVELILQGSPEGAEICAVRDFMNERMPEVDRKYDYRCSVLVDVFGRLVVEGWLHLDECTALDGAELALIRDRSALWRLRPGVCHGACGARSSVSVLASPVLKAW